MFKVKLKKNTLHDYKNKDINLLPQEIINKKKHNLHLATAILLSSAIVFSSVGYYYYLFFQVKKISNENEIKITQISELLEKEEQQKLLSLLQERIEIKNQQLMDIERSNISIPFLTSVIENSLPADISFLNLAITTEGEISINGVSSSELSIAELIHNLKETKYFEQVFVGNITYSSGSENRKIYSFNLICQSRGN